MSREQQKEMRRLALVEAAEALIRETGDTDFSMLTLAQRAQLSPTTPYNLFGSKSAILYALLNSSADRMFDSPRRGQSGGDPFQRVLRAADVLADTLTRDPAFYRPLYRFLFGVIDPVYRPAFMNRSQRYWEEAVGGLVEAGLLPPGLRQQDLARQFVIQATGAVDLWVQFELDETQLTAQLRHGSCLMLMGLAPELARKMLLVEIVAASRELPGA